MEELTMIESVVRGWKEEEDKNKATLKEAKKDEEILRKKLRDTSKEVETFSTRMSFQKESITEEGIKIKKLEERMDEHRTFVKEFIGTTGGQRNKDMSEDNRKLVKTNSLWHITQIKNNTAELSYMRQTKNENEKERAQTERDYKEKKEEEKNLEKKLKDHETPIEILIQIEEMIRRELCRNINERDRLSKIY